MLPIIDTKLDYGEKEMRNLFVAMALAAALARDKFRDAIVQANGGFIGNRHMRRFAKHAGIEWRGEVFHGGELTAENKKRARARIGLRTA